MDNKLFWKTIKPSFFDKIVTRKRIYLNEMVKLSKLNWKLQRLSIFFFGNVIKNLMILKYSEYNPSIDRVENRTI